MPDPFHSRPVSVVLCDDVPELRLLVRLSLEEGGELKVVAEAGDGNEGIAKVRALRPDVLLLDLSMPGRDGLETIEILREEVPETQIVVFSGFVSERMGDAAISRGAVRYHEKGEPLTDIRRSILEVARAAA